jgi:hypothetical protein
VQVGDCHWRRLPSPFPHFLLSKRESLKFGECRKSEGSHLSPRNEKCETRKRRRGEQERRGEERRGEERRGEERRGENEEREESKRSKSKRARWGQAASLMVCCYLYGW